MRKVSFASGEYYHIYNRGTNKMSIFNDKDDYRRFISSLYLTNSKDTVQYSDIDKEILWQIEKGEPLVYIGAWCLMPNHFHLLIKARDEVSVSTFIQRLLTSHSKYFNKKYERTGTLFQGKTKSEHVATDRYLKYLFSYIHLNPLKLIDPNWKKTNNKNSDRAIEFLQKYTYSSLPDFCATERREGGIIKSEEFPIYFPNKKDILAELNDWITYNE